MIKKEEKKTDKKNPIWKKVIGVAIILVSLLIMAYPFISEWIFENRQDSIIETYKSDISDLEDEEIQNEWNKANTYNQQLFNSHVSVSDPFGQLGESIGNEYMSLLNLQGTGCMGYIEIPRIQVDLPIYHGTSEVVLRSGVGHLQESSLPIGGENTHTVLTGHTGLNQAKLFTDLTQLKVGDTFFLYVLNNNLAYEVDQIEVVTPEDSSLLEIESGQDYCTLVTCTPYGINSHRLLVRGHRVPYTKELKAQAVNEEKPTQSEWKKQYRIALRYAVITIVVLVGISEVVRKHKEKKKH